MLLRGAGGVLTGVIADPFDLDLQTWIETQAHARPGAPLLLRLALASDIQAYLSKQEESARAVDSLVAKQQRRLGTTARPPPCCRSPRSRKRPVRPSSWSTRPCTTRSRPKRLRHPPREHGSMAWPSSTGSTACSITPPRWAGSKWPNTSFRG
ncbi:hypothetical protein LP419_07505 [Massilia sp. H-1]|nr:hypothetical protein LP419_07505 [Massilia sp. H-1]